MHRLELNSPAGDMECVKAAVYNGADSIYLGVRFFNARRLAKNFSMEELKEIVKFAHLHNVKILLTMNTLVRNDELFMWFKTLEQAYLAGIDAVIIQEIFLAPLIKSFFPGLRVHASTQASLMSYHGINSMKDLDLVVLARELTKDEIRKIRENTKTKLEVFVHGHLCISYSGQCLISSLIGRRSGNRGVCASSCRKRYNDMGYLISPKDLMLANHIDEIYKLGVNAVKIEGRMKSPEYVAVTTRTYRKQIDNAVNMARLKEKDIDMLRMGFNRDFTSGFFSGNKRIVGENMPMNRGIYLGKVRNKRLRLEAELSINDGVGFWHPRNKGKLEGFLLKKMFSGNNILNQARKGEEIFIPSKHFIENSEVYLTSRNSNGITSAKNFVDVQVDVTGSIGLPLRLEFKNLFFESSVLLQEAKTQSLSREEIISELKKSEALGIRWIIGKISLGQLLFLPKSELSKTRKAIEEKFLEEFLPKRVSRLSGLPDLKEDKPDCEPRIIVKAYTLKQVEETDNLKAYAVYYDVFNSDLEEARSICRNAKFFLDTPVILTDSDIERVEKIVSQIKPDGITIGNWGLVDTKFAGEKHGKLSLNVFNDIALKSLLEKGVLPMASVELNSKQMKSLRIKRFICYTHGRVPVMHFKGEYKENLLRDEKGYSFPLRVINGNTEMLYSRPVAFFENIKELIDSGIRYFFLDIEKNTSTLIKAYQNIINNTSQDISMLKKGTTIGNFKKGVA